METRVLVVLVATNGASWLKECLAGIAGQTHGPLDVVAVDNASGDGSRARLEKAFGKANVVALDRRAGYARAVAAGVKAAGERAAAADAFLFVHDDCAMDPGAVAALVDALGYEDVGIVGAKLVEWDNPEMLQSTGLSIDRYARAFDPLEKGELDQGQHDRVKEAMWVSSACMLVRRAVVERIGLFDQRFVLFRDDLDFCWRARLAGFKVAYVGAARARHAAASARDVRDGWGRGRTRYFIERNLLAALVKNYSRPRLALYLPVAIALGFGAALLDVASGRRREAGQIVEALRWNLAHAPSSIRARARSQRARTTPDAEVMRLTYRGAHRVRSLAERAFERVAGEPAEGLEEAEGLAAPGERLRPRIRDRIRAHPVGSAAIVLTVLYLIGSRHLLMGGGLAGADMPPFPDAPGDFFRSYFSGWRSAGTGSAGPAPAASFLAGALSIVTLGSTWIAQRLLVAALIPIAGLTASRLAAALGCGPGARRVAAFAYALSPTALSALSDGRISDLVLAAAAPGLCVPLLRAAGFAPWTGWRALTVPAAGLAVAAAFAPWAIPLVAGAGVVFAAAAAASGHAHHAVRTICAGAAVAAAALIALFPWSIELFRDGSAFGIGGAGSGVPAEDLVRLVPVAGSPVPAWIATVFPLAAAAGLALAPKERDAAARALAIAGAVAVALAWAASRGVPWIATRPAQPLAVAAVATAALAAVGAEGARARLAARGFGATQVAATAMAIALAFAVAAGGVWLVRGSRPGLVASGALAPAFLASDRAAFGEFRVLWIDGDPARVRADLAPAAGETFVSYAERRAGAGQDALDRLLAGIAAGRIDAGGRQLASFGVRYVFVRPTAAPSLGQTLARQTDLRFVQRFNDTQVFANDAWIPVAASVGAPGWTAASSARGSLAPIAIAAAESNPLRGDGFARVSSDVYAGSVREGAKRVLLATTFDARWRLIVPDAGKRASAERSFGWANGFAAAAAGRAAVVWEGQGRHRFLLLGQLAILVAIGVGWSRRVALERGER